MEYIITTSAEQAIIHVERDGRTTHLVPSVSAYRTCTKFKSKQRAELIAKKVPGAVVVPYYGVVVTSTKSSVTPKQSHINRSTPYRSC